jgi:hypothetical protein
MGWLSEIVIGTITAAIAGYWLLRQQRRLSLIGSLRSIQAELNSHQRDLDILCDSEDSVFRIAGEFMPMSVWEQNKDKLADLLHERGFHIINDYYERDAKDLVEVIRSNNWSRAEKKNYVYQVCHDLYQRNEAVLELVGKQLDSRRTWLRRVLGF